MLKFENLAEIGQKIRAYDFMGNKEAYIEGTVLDKGWVKCPQTGMEMYKGYTIQIEKDGIQEQFGREGDIGYVAFETSLEYDDRVELIKTEYSPAAECVGV